jgi:hypothetical protein
VVKKENGPRRKMGETKDKGNQRHSANIFVKKQNKKQVVSSFVGSEVLIIWRRSLTKEYQIANRKLGTKTFRLT